MKKDLLQEAHKLDFFPESLVPDGKIHRFKRNRDAKNPDAWYFYVKNYTSIGNEFGILVLGDWKTGAKFKLVSSDRLSKTEKVEIASKQAEAQKAFDLEKLKLQNIAAKNAQREWLRCRTGPFPISEYLRKKQIAGLFGARYLLVNRGVKIMVPMVDERGDLRGIQSIYDDGGKWFRRDQQVHGTYHSIGENPDTIIICEGFATGATLYEATGFRVHCAFTAYNLGHVASITRKLHSNAKIIIAADNDQWTPKNPGIKAAELSAALVGAQVMVPEFKSVDAKPTDFNDLHCLEGIEQVKRAFEQCNGPLILNLDDMHLAEIKTIVARKLADLNGKEKMYCFQDIIVTIDGEPGNKRTVPMSADALFGKIIENVHMVTIDKLNEQKVKKPDKDLAKVMFATPPEVFSSIKILSKMPVFSIDRHLISCDGYSPSTQIFIDSNFSNQLRDIPSKPSQDDLEEAKAIILTDVFGDFPFESLADRAHAIGMLIQGPARLMIAGPTPLYSIEAPMAGTGKTLLAKVVHIILTGQAPMMQSLPGNNDDIRKLILSALLSAPSVMIFDNVPVGTTINSAVLANVLTEESLIRSAHAKTSFG